MGSITKMKCCNKYQTAISPTNTHQDSHGCRFMDYDMNVKCIVLGYTHGVGGGDLDAMAVLFDLHNGRNLTRNFSRHQEVAGESIRDYIIQEMELSLEMELKVTIMHKESKEYYDEWVKIEKKEKKKLGLTVLYDMGCQRRSSGDNYASLPGHGFLIGVQHRSLCCI